MTQELLYKFLHNKCTETELEEVLQWAKAGAFNQKDKNLVYKDWNNYLGEDISGNDEKFTALFDSIQNEIDKQESKNDDKSTNVMSLFAKWFTRAAAIFLIPVLGFLLYIISEKNTVEKDFALSASNSLEIIAPIGSRTSVQLSDGSFVHLNFGSKLRYPLFFTGEKREVVLEGEGFFEVAHNPERPFIVKTGNMNIKALGTAFNVLAYNNDDKVETTLVNGKVVLEQEKADGSFKTFGTMVQGQHVAYHIETGKITSSKGSVEKYIAWKNGKLIFEDTHITEVAERLSRMFNVDIEVENDAKDYIYTVTFIDEPLFQILDLMTVATPVEYNASPRIKLPDGSYSKQKIIIKKKSNKN